MSISEGMNLISVLKREISAYDDIKTGIAYCRNAGVTTTFLMNAFLHEGDVDAAFSNTRRELKNSDLIL